MLCSENRLLTSFLDCSFIGFTVLSFLGLAHWSVNDFIANRQQFGGGGGNEGYLRIAYLAVSLMTMLNGYRYVIILLGSAIALR